MAEQTASMEDYLEAIAVLERQGKVARVRDISRMLKVKMPSVTSALRKLSEQGLVKHERYGYVKLTPEGERVASDVLRRHEVLRTFLVKILGVDPEIAEEDACRMEHFLSPQSLERLSKFLEFLLGCPRGTAHVISGFEFYFRHGKRPERCGFHV